MEQGLAFGRDEDVIDDGLVPNVSSSVGDESKAKRPGTCGRPVQQFVGLVSQAKIRSIQVLVGDLPPLGSLVTRTEDVEHLNKAGVLHNVVRGMPEVYMKLAMWLAMAMLHFSAS